MKFVKTSIFILFLLSLLSAGLSFYLSTIRENEKEKRIYLEGVKADLEQHVAKLESEKAALEKKVTGLESENQELTRKLNEEKEAHQKVLDQIREKDSDLENLKTQAGQAQQAFENAQKRNQELERILDELESRMRQVEAQKNISTGPNAGYIDVNLVPASPSARTPAAVPAIPIETSPKQSVTPAQESISVPVTSLPAPPKRRKFFPFLHSSKHSETEPQSFTQISEPVSTPKAAPVTAEPTMRFPNVGKSEEKIQPEEPTKKQTVTAAPHAAGQTIAAGNVLLVNRKYNFIVVNLGSRQGLNLNDILIVQQKGAEVAKVRVEKLYDDYCAAYIVEEQSQHPIGEGDAVAAT